MEVLVFLVVVVSIISSIVGKKKQDEAKRAAQTAQAARVRQAENMRARVQNNVQGNRPAPSPIAPTVRPNPPTPNVFTPQYSGSMAYDSTEGMGGTQGTVGTEGTSFGSTEGMGGTQGRSELVIDYNKPRHIVAPSRESGHTHTETSITGVSDCAPDSMPLEFEHEDAYSHERSTRGGLKLDVSKNAVLQGVIFSEIIGKPRALRRYSRA